MDEAALLRSKIDFQGQVVLITGASSGIGGRLAIDFASRGATVIGCGRGAERLQRTEEEMRRANRSCAVIACDVGDRRQVGEMVAKVVADFGRIDVLINNAGIGMRKPFVETSVEMVEAIMRTNYFGTVYCTHAVLPSMVARGKGHIVNISSVAGKMGTPRMTGYCASKFAVNGFSESLYHELEPLGICVSVVCPGSVKTDFNKSFADRQPQSPSLLGITPEAVSRAVITAIEQRTFEVVIPRSVAWICWFKRMTPNLFRSISHRVFQRRIAKAKKA
jgi:short-subunit dehydrogenase